MRGVADRPTVAELVAAAQAGDHRSWTELIGRYDGMVRAVATGFRLQEADVGDAAQGAWLRALEQLGDLRDPDRFGGWLRTIVLRECLAVQAAGRREHLDSQVADHAVEPAPGPEEQVLRAETQRAVRAAVNGLHGRGRILVEILFYRPRAADYEMTARAADMPVGSIGPTRARALQALRRRLEYTGFAPGSTGCRDR